MPGEGLQIFYACFLVLICWKCQGITAASDIQHDKNHSLTRLLCFFAGVCPLLCSGHGVYGGGECHCVDGWKGPECEVRSSECLTADCSGHGQCREGVCICNPGWTGEHCQTSKYCVTLSTKRPAAES